MINYETLKSIASEIRAQGLGIKVSDLVTLAPKNDPFYAGAPAQMRDGEWFANLYNRLTATIEGSAVHLRRMHYLILELPDEDRRLPVPLSTGNIDLVYYENYERCWDYLREAAKSARYLNLVPIDAFVDNRAKEVTFSFYALWPRPDDWNYEDPTPGYHLYEDEYDTPWQHELPDLPLLEDLPGIETLPYMEVTGYDNGIQQPYHIEIWVEKSEGDDVFLPLCARYGVNFVPGVGDMSITTTYRFCERVREANRPAKLLYISDFDPSGFNMPVAVARKLEHFCRNYGFHDLDITLEPLMLTADQVTAYNLPPKPIKQTDARKDKWEEQYGGAVELNAMFARADRISAARGIVEKALLKYFDTTLISRARRQRYNLLERIREEEQAILEGYDGEVQDLDSAWEELAADWNDLQTEFQALVEPLRDRLAAYRDRLAELDQTGSELWERITQALNQIDFDAAEEYPLPEPDVETATDDLLYHSQRGYWSQMSHYHHYKSNGSDSEAGQILDILAEREAK